MTNACSQKNNKNKTRETLSCSKNLKRIFKELRGTLRIQKNLKYLKICS